MLQQYTQPTSLYKICAHSNIASNKMADALAKASRFKQQLLHLLYEHAHPTPFYIYKNK